MIYSNIATKHVLIIESSWVERQQQIVVLDWISAIICDVTVNAEDFYPGAIQTTSLTSNVIPCWRPVGLPEFVLWQFSFLSFHLLLCVLIILAPLRVLHFQLLHE